MAIRSASQADGAQLAALYAHHVLHGTATFETVPPDDAEMAGRITRVLDHGWPWLVAEEVDGAIAGYAYATQFRDRAAYRFACENSIYLRRDRLGQGIGTRLLEDLLAASTACGFRQMIAVIAGTEPASVALHARAGFGHAGKLTSAGRKHGRWIDVVYMQRALGDGDRTAPGEEPR